METRTKLIQAAKLSKETGPPHAGGEAGSCGGEPAENVSIMAVARKHGIGMGLLYGWRHQLLGRRSGEAAGFAIEIVLPDGTSVRVDAQVDEYALRRVLGALRG